MKRDDPEATPTPRTARATSRTWRLAVLLGTLAMLGPYAIDAYLPAFHAIGSDLGVAQLAVQQTLSTFLFAYAFMMLWHGALADAFGRRPVVLASLGVFAIATLGCAIAGNIQSLWLFRTLQGLSAGAGIVAGRAIIRDLHYGTEAQRLMSQVTLIFGIAPAIAPVIGGALLNLLGWRSIFYALLAFTLALLVWTARRLPETLAPEARQKLAPGVMWRNYTQVLARLEFALLALVPALSFCAFFIYISTAPAFLVDRLGVTTWGFAWLFVPMIAGVMIGAALSGRLAGRIRPVRQVAIGFAIMFAAATANVAICAAGPSGTAWYVAPVMVYSMGHAMVTPCVMLLVLDLFPRNRGLATSLQGFVQFAMAGVVAGTIAPLLAEWLIALALGMAACTLAAFASWRLYRRRDHAQSKR